LWRKRGRANKLAKNEKTGDLGRATRNKRSVGGGKDTVGGRGNSNKTEDTIGGVVQNGQNTKEKKKKKICAKAP